MNTFDPSTHRPPRWFAPLVVWRGLVVVGLGLLLILRPGLGLEGAFGAAAMVGNVLFVVLAGAAAWFTYRRRHRGRVLGFATDLVLAVTVGSLTLNRLGFFVGLDSVGARFNQRILWIAPILVGMGISAWAERGGESRPAIKRVGWTVSLAGTAALLLAMGLLGAIPGVVARIVESVNLPWVIVAVAATLAARLGRSDASAEFFATDQRQAEHLDGLVFIAPNVIGFLVFFAGPLLFSLAISFTEWSGLRPPTFTGLDNYVDLISDALFLRSLRNILIFCLVAVPLTVVPAVLLAALLNSKLPGIRVFRAVYFLPSIAGVVGVTLIWKQLFNATVGFLNYSILEVTALFNSVAGTTITAPQPLWISSANVAMISVMILFVWQRIGFDTVLFLAGMQGIDGSLYEAADIDGANAWARFRQITVPLLKPTTFFVVITDIILALQMFNEPFILQAPSTASGPGNSTLTPVIYLYQQAFQQFQIGYGSAVAWVLFVLIFGITLVYFRRQGEEGFLKA
jgi:ABC-type sugar transport system permease subunit